MRRLRRATYRRGIGVAMVVGLLLSLSGTDALAKTAKPKPCKKGFARNKAKKCVRKVATTTSKKVTTTVAPRTATTGAAKGTVKLGVLSTSIDERTGQPKVDETRELAKAWQADVNAGGGINGYRVELVMRDFKADPSRQLQAVKELHQAGVLAIAGPVTFDLKPSVDYIDKNKVTLVGGYQNYEAYDTDPNLFQVVSSFFAAAYSAVANARDHGAKTYMSAYCTEVAACSGAVPKARYAAEREGLRYFAQGASAAAPDYTPLCLTARDNNVEYINSAGLNFANLVRDCQRQNFHPIYHNAGNNTQATIDAALGNRVGGTYFEPPATYTGPEMARFHALARKAGVEDDKNAANFSTVDAFLGFEMAARALQFLDGPNPTPADYRQALYKIKDETLGGLVPPTTYAVQGNGGKYANDCWIESTVVDGKYRIINKSGQPVDRVTWVCGTGFKYGT